MSDTSAILSKLEHDTKHHVHALHEAVCSFSGRLADAAGDVTRAEDIRHELVQLIYDALISPCGAIPEYDVNLLPDWMGSASQPYAPRGGG